MTKEETKVIFHLVRDNYPKYFKDMAKSEMQGMIALWSAAFADDDPRAIQTALVQYVRTDTTGFPPTVGQLRSALPQPKFMPAEVAWQMIMRRVTSDAGEAKKYYLELPQDVQEALGGWSRLITIGQCSIERDLPWYRKEFIKNYNEICDESKSFVNRGVWQLEYVEAKNQKPQEEMLMISENGRLIDGSHRIGMAE